jgi:hypothetical protein
LAWKLISTMNAQDILEVAQEKAGIENVKVCHRPRSLSDNTPCYLSRDLKAFQEDRIDHISVRLLPQNESKSDGHGFFPL